MKKILLLILLIFNSFYGYSQKDTELSCGTEINATNTLMIKQVNEEWFNRKQTTELQSSTINIPTRYIPVQIHIIRQDNGTGGISALDTDAAFKRLNEYYIGAQIHFYKCSPINYIDDSTFYDYNKTQVSSLHNTYSSTNVLNLYVANTTVNSSGATICGHAYFPGSIDFVMQSKSCIKNGSTLAHEVGHYLGLYHTHETKFGNEAVNGSDCASEGDLICDTPADPRLSRSSNINEGGCTYYGTTTDENGNTYNASVTNIMSNSPKGCRYTFTEGQKQKLRWTLENQRSYLTCGNSTLNADFYITEEQDCTTGKEFSFYNTSEGTITSHSWDFGDGTGTSTLESPNYTYTNNGIYIVTLTVNDGTTVKTLTKTVTVGAVTIPYSNNFDNGANDLNKFNVANSLKNATKVSAIAGKNGSNGLLFDGLDQSSNSPFFETPSKPESFKPLWNHHYKSTAKLCVDATNVTNLQLEFDKRQLRTSNDAYTNFRITVNGTMIGKVYRVYSANTDDPNFIHNTVDLSAYDGQLITIGFEGSHKYDKDRNGTNKGNATFIDNISLTGNVTVLSVNKNTLEKSKLYPNPTTGKVTIVSANNINNLQVLNILGQNLTKKTKITSIENNKSIIDLSNLEAGVYYIKTNSGTNMVLKK